MAIAPGIARWVALLLGASFVLASVIVFVLEPRMGFTSLADQIEVVEAPTTNWPLLLAIALGTLLLLALIVVFIIKRRRTNVADGAPKTVRLEDEPTQQL